jgi:Tfp pilus assembly protein PilF
MRIASLVLAIAALASCSRPSFQGFFSSGEEYLAAGKHPEAVIEFQNAARADPASVAVQLKLAEAYAAMAQPANAAAAVERACTLDPGNVSVCLDAASQLLAVGEYDRAGAAARQVLTKDRFNLDADLMLASSLAGVRRFADAEERVRAVLAVAPHNSQAYRALGAVQYQRGDAAAAEASFLQAIKLDPSSADGRTSLAQLYFDTGRPAYGEQQLRAALALNPIDLTANRMYASYLVETNFCADAEPYWQTVAAQSKDRSGSLALADYYVWSQRPADALRVLEPLAAADDPGGVARARMAAILYDRGDRAEAARVVDELLAEDSGVDGLVLKARMSLDAPDMAQARDYAHRAAAVAPPSPAVRDVLAAIAAVGSDR